MRGGRALAGAVEEGPGGGPGLGLAEGRGGRPEGVWRRGDGGKEPGAD